MENFNSIIKDINRTIRRNNEKIEAFKTSILESGIEYSISWRAEEAIKAEHMNKDWNWAIKDSTNVAELEIVLKDIVEGHMRSIMGNYNRSNSTCAWTNSSNNAKHSATLEVVNEINQYLLS